jgi:hypothetical protein
MKFMVAMECQWSLFKTLDFYRKSLVDLEVNGCYGMSLFAIEVSDCFRKSLVALTSHWVLK